MQGGAKSSNLITIEESSFINNSAVATDLSKGGAISLVGSELAGSPSIVCTINSDCSFINNTAVFGGAISSKEASLLLEDASLTENNAGHGGALWIQVSSSLNVKPTSILNVCTYLIASIFS